MRGSACHQPKGGLVYETARPYLPVQTTRQTKRKRERKLHRLPGDRAVVMTARDAPHGSHGTGCPGHCCKASGLFSPILQQVLHIMPDNKSEFMSPFPLKEGMLVPPRPSPTILRVVTTQAGVVPYSVLLRNLGAGQNPPPSPHTACGLRPARAGHPDNSVAPGPRQAWAATPFSHLLSPGFSWWGVYCPETQVLAPARPSLCTCPGGLLACVPARPPRLGAADYGSQAQTPALSGSLPITPNPGAPAQLLLTRAPLLIQSPFLRSRSKYCHCPNSQARLSGPERQRDSPELTQPGRAAISGAPSPPTTSARH